MTCNTRHTKQKGNILTIIRMSLLVGALALHPLATSTWAVEPLPGEYLILEGEPSLHSPGKVLLLEFVDFYCPHCHLFDRTVASTLQKEFGDRLEVRIVGFPVIRGTLPTAFEMYEQARAMGQGAAMKDVLFQTIHQDKIRVFDKSLRALLVKNVGLNSQTFETGLASGQPYRAVEKGKAWGKRIGVTHTPTVVLDGNLKVENLAIDNVRTVINGILAHNNAP